MLVRLSTSLAMLYGLPCLHLLLHPCTPSIAGKPCNKMPPFTGLAWCCAHAEGRKLEWLSRSSPWGWHRALLSRPRISICASNKLCNNHFFLRYGCSCCLPGGAFVELRAVRTCALLWASASAIVALAQAAVAGHSTGDGGNRTGLPREVAVTAHRPEGFPGQWAALAAARPYGSVEG